MIEIMIFVMLIIVWFNEYVVVDEHFILHKKGIFFTKEARHKLDTINNLSIEQNLISKVLRYGDVIISHSNDEITLLHHIPYPNQLVYLIEQKIEVVQEKNSKQEMFKK
ncbi:MAG: PH domain-containing protein [Patescibacteria group bacterium]